MLTIVPGVFSKLSVRFTVTHRRRTQIRGGTLMIDLQMLSGVLQRSDVVGHGSSVLNRGLRV